MIEQSRRGFLTGLAALVAAPAIVRATSIMPVKPVPLIAGEIHEFGGMTITESGLISLVRKAKEQLAENCIRPINGRYIVYLPPNGVRLYGAHFADAGCDVHTLGDLPT